MIMTLKSEDDLKNEDNLKDEGNLKQPQTEQPRTEGTFAMLWHRPR